MGRHRPPTAFFICGQISAHAALRLLQMQKAFAASLALPEQKSSPQSRTRGGLISAHAALKPLQIHKVFAAVFALPEQKSPPQNRSHGVKALVIPAKPRMRRIKACVYPTKYTKIHYFTEKEMCRMKWLRERMCPRDTENLRYIIGRHNGIKKTL